MMMCLQQENKVDNRKIVEIVVCVFGQDDNEFYFVLVVVLYNLALTIISKANEKNRLD